MIKRIQEKGLIKSNRDFPQIIINSIPAPELIYEKIEERDLIPYITGLKDLERFGVDFIVIVCNTIHLFYDTLQREIKTPILDLRNEVRKFLVNRNINSVLVIGTPATIKERLYGFECIRIFEPDEDELKILSECIFNFNNGIDKNIQIKMTKEICKKYLALGAESIILGCTEFAVMLSQEDLPTINTVDILVESTINKFYKQFNP